MFLQASQPASTAAGTCLHRDEHPKTSCRSVTDKSPQSLLRGIVLMPSKPIQATARPAPWTLRTKRHCSTSQRAHRRLQHNRLRLNFANTINPQPPLRFHRVYGLAQSASSALLSFAMSKFLCFQHRRRDAAEYSPPARTAHGDKRHAQSPLSPPKPNPYPHSPHTLCTFQDAGV